MPYRSSLSGFFASPVTADVFVLQSLALSGAENTWMGGRAESPLQVLIYLDDVWIPFILTLWSSNTFKNRHNMFSINTTFRNAKSVYSWV